MRMILAAVTALGLTTTFAAAGVPKTGLDVANAAFKKLDERANQTRSRDALPRWTVPDDRAILEQIWNAPLVLGTPPYTAQDLQPLINIGLIENSVLRSYVLYSPNPAIPADPTKNVVAFQDEILRGQAFAVRLSAAMLAALSDYASHAKFDQLTGEKGDNLKDLRVDLVERAQAASESIGNMELTVENRTMLADAMADSAEPLAIASTKEDREKFADTADKAIPSLSPAEQARIKLFVGAMARKDCQTLCSLP